MKRTHPAFWGAGWAGTFIGAVLVMIGITSPADFGSLAGGYGLMLMGSGLFLLAGLGLRRRSAVRTARPDTVQLSVQASGRS